MYREYARRWLAAALALAFAWTAVPLPAPDVPACVAAARSAAPSRTPAVLTDAGSRVETAESRDFDAFINPPADFSPFAGFGDGHLLFLSDGKPADDRHTPLAPAVAAAHLGTRVTQADLMIKTKRAGPGENLDRKRVDNAQPLPFEDNSMDVIVMRRGLCACGGPRCCGGIVPGVNEVAFLTEVARVLNKRNPRAGAYLLNDGNPLPGDPHTVPQDLNLWRNAAARVMEAVPGVRVIVVVRDGKFDGIVIRPAAGG